MVVAEAEQEVFVVRMLFVMAVMKEVTYGDRFSVQERSGREKSIRR
jgi:hypothetical protein